MIKQAEISRNALSNGVPDTQIEKDYVLSWLLTGLSNNSLKDDIVFKGGTVLKKYYFRDYRFSEDLDFTLINKNLSNDAIKNKFQDVFAFIKDETGMSFSIVEFVEHLATNGINFLVEYDAILGGKGKQIKIDISRDELLQFQTVQEKLIKVYSDNIDSTMNCYSLPEIITEKMRSMLQRQQPRDYYDLWYLSENTDLQMKDYIGEFRAKALYKKLAPNNFEYRFNTISSTIKKDWNKYLIKQIISPS
jgi:predicted nucleotidyltransferase component of viral defense system